MNVCSHADMSLQEYLQKKVWKEKRLCLPVLRTVVQKENLARTEKRSLQMLQQLLLDFLPVLLIDIKPQQPSLGKKCYQDNVDDCYE